MQRTLKNLILVAGVATSVAAFTGCESMNTSSSSKYMDDKAVTKNVEKTLEADPVYKYPAVKVTTYRGVTQLSGFVETEEQKRRATELARSTMGPAEIINNIVVRPVHMSPTGRESVGGTTTGTSTTSGTITTPSNSGATGTTTTTDRGVSDTTTTK